MAEPGVIYAAIWLVLIGITVPMAYALETKLIPLSSCTENMQELNQTYLCGHSIFSMIQANFFPRLTAINDGEGFCYTVSAAVMLGLKNCKRSRLVRGYIRLPNGQTTKHSWVEIKLHGHWWIVDPVIVNFYRRYGYHHELHAKVMKVYSYQEFWDDLIAPILHERLMRPETSKIFVDLCYRYTPRAGSGKIDIPDVKIEELYLGDDGKYRTFPPNEGYKFTQRIVNELMARPTRRSPRRRTLRLLDKYYRVYRAVARESARESST